jgi:predicted dehydrogenase
MVNIAVIGCGSWGPNHIRNFNSIADSKIIFAVDVDPHRISHIVKMFPGVCVENNYQTVFKDPNIDAVVIATPTSTHYQLVREALIAGKHVLCEKPLCISSKEGYELVELAGSKKLILMVGHVFLFNKGILKLKELLQQDGLGDLYYLSAIRANFGPIRDDVNVAFDLSSHDIAIFNWLLDSEPEVVTATGGSFLQQNVEDVVFVNLRYPGNICANIQSSWLNPKKVRQITVVGSKKMLTWDDLELNTPIAIYDKGAKQVHEYSDYGEFLRISMWDGDVRMPKVEIEEPLRLQDRFFVESIKQGYITKSDGLFALGVVKVLEAISESLKHNAVPVQVKS